MARALVHTPHFRYRLPVAVGIEGLTDRQREIVHLRCAEELTIPATAYRLCISESGLKKMVHRIMEKTGHVSMYGVCVEYGRSLERKVPVNSLHAEDV